MSTRSTTRQSKKAPPPKKFNWGLLVALFAIAVLGVGTAIAGYRVRQFVIDDPQFLLSRDHKDAITIQGLRFASRLKVQRVFAGDYGQSIYNVPLDERRRRLLAIDWIEDASVSRVWPDRLVITVRERRPIAFINLRSGVRLIDSLGKVLDPPNQSQFAFPVLSGLGGDESDAKLLEHVRTFQRVQEDLGYLIKEISEVDTTDADNIRLITQVDQRALSLLMGDGNYAARYQNFLKNYPEIVKRSPNARIFDLRLDDRITTKD